MILVEPSSQGFFLLSLTGFASSRNRVRLRRNLQHCSHFRGFFFRTWKGYDYMFMYIHSTYQKWGDSGWIRLNLIQLRKSFPLAYPVDGSFNLSMHYLFRTHLLREQHKIKELILCTLDGLITGVDPYRMDPPHLLLFCRGGGY